MVVKWSKNVKEKAPGGGPFLGQAKSLRANGLCPREIGHRQGALPPGKRPVATNVTRPGQSPKIVELTGDM
jgi:hypothetical protein